MILLLNIILCCCGFLLVYPSYGQNQEGIDFQKCGMSKICLKHSDAFCSRDDCSFGVTYTHSSKDPQYVHFELFAPLERDYAFGQYLALGLSKDAKMGDDSVIICKFLPTDSNELIVAYNPSGYQRTKVLAHRADSKLYKDVSYEKTEEICICRFSRMVNPSHEPRLDFQRIFSLDQHLYPLVAVGELDDREGIVQHGSSMRAVVGGIQNFSNISFTESESSSNSFQDEQIRSLRRKAILFKAHGILMLFSWWVFTSCAILLARYFKTWPTKRICKLAIWFQLHRVLNLLSISAVIAGLVCIFTARDWVFLGALKIVGGASDSQLHASLGLTSSILLFVQPILAIFRCGPSSPFRSMFNRIHSAIGKTAWLISSIAIWYSATLPFLTYKPKDILSFYKLYRGIVFGYVAFSIAVIVLGDLLNSLWLGLAKIGENAKEAVSSIHPSAPPKSPSRFATEAVLKISEEVPEVPKFGPLRLMLLLLYLAISIAMSVVLAILIGKS